MLLPPELAASGIGARLLSVSALDSYSGWPPAPVLLAETDADHAALARAFPEADYPGLWYADFSAPSEGRRVRFRFVESLDRESGGPWGYSAFRYDERRKLYLDPANVRADFRLLLSLKEPAPEPGKPLAGYPEEELLFEAAIVASRTGAALDCRSLSCPPDFPAQAQRDMLELVLTGRRPDLGLEALRQAGFIEAFWPEIGALMDVEHSREHHPEGGAWLHTLETFRYRKRPDDLLVAVSLLLHDTGKPEAGERDGRRFDRHAELGQAVAAKFLRRLGYGEGFTRDVGFMVKNHMMPEALPRLPLFRTQEALENPLFPALLELYRCDVSSTFRGPQGYYDACKAYRQYLRNVKNPYRSADGKKLGKQYLE